MGLGAFKLTKPSLSVATANYSDKTSFQNLSTLRVSANNEFLGGGTLSADVGNSYSSDYNDEKGMWEATVGPAFEGKYKQNFSDNTSCYIRGRLNGNNNWKNLEDKTKYKKQIRFDLEYKQQFCNGVTGYIDGHITGNFKHNEDAKWKCGVFAGFSTPIEKVSGLSAWAEIQKDFEKGKPFKDQLSLSTLKFNFGATYKLPIGNKEQHPKESNEGFLL